MNFLPLVLKNLGRNKRRTILTVISIAVSLFIFAALMSLPAVIDQILRERANSERLICHSKGGLSYPLPAAYLRRIQTLPHVEAAIGENLFMGTYRSPNDEVPSAAMDAEQIELVLSDFGISKRAAEEFRRLRSASLVGKVLMRRFGWRVGQQVILRGTIYPVDLQLTVAGTLGDKAPPYAMLFRRDYLREVLRGPDSVNLFWIKVDGSRAIPGVIARIDSMFANSPAETETESEIAASQSQIGAMRVIFDGVKLLALIVTIAIALVAANTAAMSVRERRREIAVMRSIGFSRELVLSCLLAEGVAIGIVGGGLGCAIAYFTLWMVPYASAALGPLALILRLPLSVLIESFVVAAAIGLVASLVPALVVTNRRISDTLRAA